jgi:hypothetical protein
MHRIASMAALLVICSSVQLLTGGSSGAVAEPEHAISVTGSGVETFPAFSPGINRYAVTTTAATGGAVLVSASTTDAAGGVTIDARPVANGSAVPVSGLDAGDEINVAITDSSGTTSQSFIYLPADFPALTATSQGTGPTPGFVFLGLATFASKNAYEAIVDPNGVPIYVRAGAGSDFKVSDANPTHFSIARPIPQHGYEILDLDEQFQPVASHQLVGVPDSTDFHDAELLPGGGALLLGYHGAVRGGVGLIDAVIQIVDAAGDVTFAWDSKDHVDPAEAYVDGGIGDYAHINSLQRLPNGDILASFRNLGQVMRIATSSHDGFDSGDVIWRLGGELGDFTFVGDPYGGNCAQHMARMLPNGHLMIFDNGSRKDLTGPIASQSANMCPDPADPAGPRIARPQSRVTEYVLDETAHTATLDWSFVPAGRYAAFAGNEQRLANGNTFVGWSRSEDLSPSPTTPPIATEVDAVSGDEVWSVTANGWFSYRAFKYPAPDRIKPVVTLSGPVQGATYVEGASVVADYGCTDRGGSNLQTCSGPVAPGEMISKTPGPHTFTVQATDGIGNTTSRSVHYVVRPAFQPDSRIRKPGGPWRGENVYGGYSKQATTFSVARAGTSRIAQVSVQNDGAGSDRFRLIGAAGTPAFPISYFHGTTDVTARVVAGTLRTPMLARGDSYAMRIVVKRSTRASVGSQRVARLQAVSVNLSGRHDVVAAIIRAIR